MNIFKLALITSAIVCASTTHALEVTAVNDVKNVESGLAARLAAIVAAFNDLKDQFTVLETTVNGFAARITTAEANITSIKTNGTKNKVQLWNPDLEARFDAIEADVTTIKGKGAKNEVSAWNTRLETRLDNIEALDVTQNTRLAALESQSGGTLKYVTTVTYTPTSQDPANLSNDSWVSYHMCNLSDVGAQTTDDNHGHRCKMEISAGSNKNQYRLTGYSRRMATQCAMQCYNY